jgi:hypothetical protein
MKRIILSGIIYLIIIIQSHSQGCLPIRNIAGFEQFSQLGYSTSPDTWMINISGRYFKAFQPINGTTKVPIPASAADRWINFNRTLNISINKALKNDWSLALDVPMYSNESIGSREHASHVRHATNSFGLGDIRFTVYKWILKSDPALKGNIELGLGIKLATGDYKYQDYFYNDPANLTARTLAPVDPSIQLGDGGTGFTTQLNAFYIFNNYLSIYGNFFYLISPRDQNGVSNQKGVIAIPPTHKDTLVYIATYKSGEDVNSVPDNYTLRTGVNFTYSKFVLTAGFRYEGAPSRDLFGGNSGLRRVGHIFSFEPGLQFKFKKGFLYTFYTLPLARETIQSVPDKTYSVYWGSKYISQGRFANYLIFVGYAFTL